MKFVIIGFFICLSGCSETFDSGTYGMQSQDPNYRHPGYIDFDEYKKRDETLKESQRKASMEAVVRNAEQNYNRQIEQAKAGHN